MVPEVPRNRLNRIMENGGAGPHDFAPLHRLSMTWRGAREREGESMKIGDLVYSYYIDDPEDEIDVTNWDASVIVERNGQLRAIYLKDDREETPARDIENHFPTKREALVAAAKKEEEYAEKCLACARKLREVAATIDEVKHENP